MSDPLRDFRQRAAVDPLVGELVEAVDAGRAEVVSLRGTLAAVREIAERFDGYNGDDLISEIRIRLNRSDTG